MTEFSANPAVSAFLGRQPRRTRATTRWIVCVLAVGILAGVLLPVSSAAAQDNPTEPDVERYYTKPVQWMIENHIVVGTAPACFGPEIPATRGETALYIWRMQGRPEAPPHPFTDVNDETQQEAVSWMYHREITTGTSPTTFAPNGDLTRAQLAALLHRLAGEPSASNHPFVDVVAGWQQQPVAWMVDNNLTTGTSPTTFAPDAPVTRGQLATFLYRYQDSPPVTVMPNSASCDTFSAVDSGQQHACAIRGNGTIACWGLDSAGQADPPHGYFKAISAGTWHTCALRTDNTIACWGHNSDRQTDVPTGRFTAISSGGNHSCGLRTDATIACWGNNLSGQTNAVPGQFISVNAGSNHTCGLRLDNTISCWGDSNNGQADAPPGQFTSVSAGWLHTCALRTDNTLNCWGDNTYSQANAPPGQFTSVSSGQRHTCGLGTDNTVTCWGADWDRQINAPTELFVAISSGGDHSCGLRTDATIACWGVDWRARTTAPSGQFAKISAGGGHTCAIRANNTITCWGDSNYFDPFGSFKTVSAGDEHTCATRANNTLTCWGKNDFGQTNAPDGHFKAVSAGVIHTCAIRINNTIACWGHNTHRQADAPTEQFIAVGAGQVHTCAIRVDNTIACWGANWSGRTDAPAGQFTSVSAGREHTCAIRVDNTIACWGVNWNGQTDAPEGPFTSVSAGQNHTCAIHTDTTVTCWGNQRSSQAESFAAVSSGARHSCGLRQNGEVSCWSELIKPVPLGVEYVVDADTADPRMCRPFGVDGFSAGFPLPHGVVRSKGTVRVAVLFVDFPNAEATHSTHTEAELGLPYAESYLEASSYGQLDIEFVPLHRWLRAENDYEHYFETVTLGGNWVGDSIRLEAAQLADPEVDFSGVDSIMVVLPSSHFAGGLAPGSISTNEGSVTRSTLINANVLDQQRMPLRWGSVGAHELVHNLGLLDMYPYGAVDDMADAPTGKTWITSGFGLMGLRVAFPTDPADPNLQATRVFPNGVRRNSFVTSLEAAEMLAWSRWQLEWLDSTQITCVTETEATVTLGPVADPGSDIVMAAIPLSGTEVIVVESRRKIGYDGPREEHYPDGTIGTFPTLPTEGVLVYTVDASRSSGQLPVAIGTDPGNRQIDRYPILTDRESVTVRGYTITVESSTDTTHTVIITKASTD